MTDEKKTFLKELNEIIVGLVEIDQECAVLDALYRESSMKKIVARCDETIASIMLLREKVKATKVEQYDNSKFKSLIKTKNNQT